MGNDFYTDTILTMVCGVAMVLMHEYVPGSHFMVTEMKIYVGMHEVTMLQPLLHFAQFMIEGAILLTMIEYIGLMLYRRLYSDYTARNIRAV